MPYQIPNWIQPPESLAANWLKGVQLSSSIASERARLQQSAIQSEMEMQLKQQQMQRDMMLKQQELAMDQAYRQQQIDIKHKELAQQQQEVQLKTQAAARQVQAQAAYQQMLSSGIDPAEALMRIGPLMGESVAGFGTLAKAISDERQKIAPPEEVTYGGEKFLKIDEGHGRFRYQNIKPATDPTNRMLMMSEINDIRQQRNEAQKDADKLFETYGAKLLEPESESDNAILKSSKQQYAEALSRVDQLNGILGQYYGNRGATGPVQPGAGATTAPGAPAATGASAYQPRRAAAPPKPAGANGVKALRVVSPEGAETKYENPPMANMGPFAAMQHPAPAFNLPLFGGGSPNAPAAAAPAAVPAPEFYGPPKPRGLMPQPASEDDVLLDVWNTFRNSLTIPNETPTPTDTNAWNSLTAPFQSPSYPPRAR